MRSVLVLHSGGLDSTVALAHAVADPDVEKVLSVTFDYNQSNRNEIAAAEGLCEAWGVPHETVALAGVGTDATTEIPGRNTIFIANALRLALEGGFDEVAVGFEPGSTYKDSSLEYIDAMSRVLDLYGVRLGTPVKSNENKTETLAEALDFGVPLDLIYSCRTSPRCLSCQTCRSMMTAFEALFPNVRMTDLIHAVTKRVESYAYLVGCNSRRSYRCTGDSGGFKYLAALFALAQHSSPDLSRVITTGNWGLALVAVMKDYPFLSRDISIEFSSEGQHIMQNTSFNCSAVGGKWGTKQALSRLPRPRYLNRSVKGRFVQGHFRNAVESLGYTWDPGDDKAVDLVTA